VVTFADNSPETEHGVGGEGQGRSLGCAGGRTGGHQTLLGAAQKDGVKGTEPARLHLSLGPHLSPCTALLATLRGLK
jgi:hypothetical protein